MFSTKGVPKTPAKIQEEANMFVREDIRVFAKIPLKTDIKKCLVNGTVPKCKTTLLRIFLQRKVGVNSRLEKRTNIIPLNYCYLGKADRLTRTI